MRALLLAGTHSGVGKTTVTLAMIAAVRARGLKVRAFKVGPDFLDAAHLAAASGAACLNLDGWMLGAEGCRARLAEAATAGADIAIVEGMMGLYDGLSGADERGSTAEMAKWLDLPVALVADAAGGARSLAATVLGFRSFDPAVRLAGVIFNRIGGAGHLAYLRQALTSVPDVAFLGACPADDALHIPERHLGLALPPGPAPPAAFAEGHLDLDLLLAHAAEVRPSRRTAAATPHPAPVHLGLARDEAFCFYYPDNLELLRTAGIELVAFSPLRDRALPAGVRGLYFGGGYPELHAAALSANGAMRAAVAAFAQAGGFIYAECGGLMYLAASLDGQPMAGVLPGRVTMHSKLQAIGYREVRPVGLGAEGAIRARGHEFHYSSLSRDEDGLAPAHEVMLPDGSTRPEGFHWNNVIASYIHLHFASCPALLGMIRECLEGARAQRRPA